jgi:AbrB family looped-hinge helix DNA binding protein
MIARLKIDRAGRVLLPKRMRDQLRLRPGDSLEMECSDRCVILRPVRGGRRIYKKQGVWVMSSGKPLDADVVEKTIRQIRDERHRRNLGKLR